MQAKEKRFMNILLVRNNERQDSVFAEISLEFRKHGVRSLAVWDLLPTFKHRLWSLGSPTTVLAFHPLRRFFPSWADIVQQVNYHKGQEQTRLESAGIQIPKWKMICQGESPDLSAFSSFVVVKPSYGARGAFVRIMRRDRVRWREFNVENRRNQNNDLIVQEYIHTGPWPSSYRVATVFGEPNYALHITASHDRLPIEYNPLGDLSMFAGRSIVASSKGCKFDEDIPDDVFDFAKEIHLRAFPDVPLLASDIIRDFNTGTLYALEVNTAGLSVLMVPSVEERIRREFNIDVSTQFGGAKAIARGILKRFNQESLIPSESERLEEMVVS
jgi:hypothetical protein